MTTDINELDKILDTLIDAGETREELRESISGLEQAMRKLSHELWEAESQVKSLTIRVRKLEGARGLDEVRNKIDKSVVEAPSWMSTKKEDNNA